jgi:hypothetical protein
MDNINAVINNLLTASTTLSELQVKRQPVAAAVDAAEIAAKEGVLARLAQNEKMTEKVITMAVETATAQIAQEAVLQLAIIDSQVDAVRAEIAAHVEVLKTLREELRANTAAADLRRAEIESQTLAAQPTPTDGAVTLQIERQRGENIDKQVRLIEREAEGKLRVETARMAARAKALETI